MTDLTSAPLQSGLLISAHILWLDILGLTSVDLRRNIKLLLSELELFLFNVSKFGLDLHQLASVIADGGFFQNVLPVGLLLPEEGQHHY